VLLAVCQKFEIEIDRKIVPQIAYYFAGGIGNTGSICGAVAGAVMATGVKLGRPETMREGLGKLAVAQEFRRRFEAEMGSVGCRELTGVDLATEEGLGQFMNSDIPNTVCFPAVGLAYRLVVDLLEETE
jgi:C_GCAxxG_C_C family probable redox protein